MSFMKPEEDLNEMVPSSIVSLTPETNPNERVCLMALGMKWEETTVERSHSNNQKQTT